MDFLLSPALLAIGDAATLHALWQDMKYKDWFMALLDVEDYIAAKTRALAGYEDRAAWGQKDAHQHRPGGLFQRRPHHRAVQRRDLAAVRRCKPFCCDATRTPMHYAEACGFCAGVGDIGRAAASRAPKARLAFLLYAIARRPHIAALVHLLRLGLCAG